MSERITCPECDGEGVIETYPPHSINAYDGAGNVITDEHECPNCGGTGYIESAAGEGGEPEMCAECGIYPADPPRKVCPGCEAYREHQA